MRCEVRLLRITPHQHPEAFFDFAEQQVFELEADPAVASCSYVILLDLTQLCLRKGKSKCISSTVTWYHKLQKKPGHRTLWLESATCPIIMRTVSATGYFFDSAVQEQTPLDTVRGVLLESFNHLLQSNARLRLSQATSRRVSPLVVLASSEVVLVIAVVCRATVPPATHGVPILQGKSDSIEAPEKFDPNNSADGDVIDATTIWKQTGEYCCPTSKCKAAFLWLGSQSKGDFWTVGAPRQGSCLILPVSKDGISRFRGFEMGTPYFSTHLKCSYEKMLNQLKLEELIDCEHRMDKSSLSILKVPSARRDF